MTSTHAINVFLTSGDVFCREYATAELAQAAYDKLKSNPLVVHISLHDEQDKELANFTNA